MRGTVAKRIRSLARKMAARNPTEYKIRWFERLLGKSGPDGRPAREMVGTVFCTGYRRVYQDTKREIKELRRANGRVH
jgi:nicotinamide mononucleotide (NMN) deamidase PncC